LSSPAGVFSAELSTLFMALRHIREVIQPPGKYLILTVSLSLINAILSRRISWRTHPLVYECNQLCFDLMRDLIEVKFMWIPSHVGLVGIELVDGETQFASWIGCATWESCSGSVWSTKEECHVVSISSEI
jgi:hypothetical protein